MISKTGLIRLKGTPQNYDWGKPGSNCLVASFSHSGSMIKVETEKPYAELWFGTHPNGPSKILDETGAEIGSLKQFLDENPSCLAADNAEVNESGLCFLFKVLSIAKALSIQAHPNKTRARELFATRPDLYKDPNHKPEMACALTEFEAFLGFESLETIVENVQATPEFLALVTQDGEEKGAKIWEDLIQASQSTDDATRKNALKQFFSLFMATDAKVVAKRVEELIARLNSDSNLDLPAAKRERMSVVNSLALRLHDQFPYDVGIFCSYVMCYRKLDPGQAVFLSANEPHAYLSGDIVEVMANSDNVIRAALTPKFKDLEELERSLTYNELPSPTREDVLHPSQILRPEVRDKNTIVFTPTDPAVDEFQLERTEVCDEHNPYTFQNGKFGSILLVVEGTGEAKWDQGMSRTPMFRGAAFFLPVGAKVSVSGNCVIYRVTRRGSV